MCAKKDKNNYEAATSNSKKLSIPLTDEMVKKGVVTKVINGIEYYDYSFPINLMLANNEIECRKHTKDIDMGLFWFRNKVNNNGPWDIKREQQWSKQIGVPYPGCYATGDLELFVFNEELLTAEQLGNMVYGYWGTCINYCAELLFLGGGIAAVGILKAEKSGPPYYGDSKEDHDYIQKGIELYQNTHI